jgi:hypothetical protein
MPIKLSNRDRADLEALAELWETTMAEAIRRAVREILSQERRRKEIGL